MQFFQFFLLFFAICGDLFHRLSILCFQAVDLIEPLFRLVILFFGKGQFGKICGNFAVEIIQQSVNIGKGLRRTGKCIVVHRGLLQLPDCAADLLPGAVLCTVAGDRIYRLQRFRDLFRMAHFPVRSFQRFVLALF